MAKRVYKKIGIYKITCISNSKIYIGSSIDIKRRIQNHKAALRNNRHDNIHLQRAWNKYGENNFTFEIIEEYSGDYQGMLVLEENWIKTTHSHDANVGFNKSEKPGAACIKTGPEHFNYGRKHSGQALINLRESARINLNDNPISREKARLAKLGQKHTLESRLKRSRVNPSKRFSEQDIIEIKNMIKASIPNKEIAKIFDVPPCKISMIKSGRIYSLYG